MIVMPDFSLTDRLFLALLGVLVSAVLGGPVAFYERLGLFAAGERFAHLIRTLEMKLNRAHRSQGERRWRGAILAIFVAALALGGGWLMQKLGAGSFLASLRDILLLAMLLPLRPALERALQVALALESHDLLNARQILQRMERRHTGPADEHGAARGAIESLAVHFAAKIIAPLFWYLALGLPGLFLSRAVGVMAQLIGYRAPQVQAFGDAALRLDDILSFIPARLAGWWLLLAACFVPQARPLKGMIIMLRDARKLLSPNAGWPLAAVAGALGITLAGPHLQQQVYTQEAWIGSGTAKAGAADVKRMLLLYASACLMLLLALALPGLSLMG